MVEDIRSRSSHESERRKAGASYASLDCECGLRSGGGAGCRLWSLGNETVGRRRLDKSPDDMRVARQALDDEEMEDSWCSIA